jgi:hypothetical protein
MVQVGDAGLQGFAAAHVWTPAAAEYRRDPCGNGGGVGRLDMVEEQAFRRTHLSHPLTAGSEETLGVGGGRVLLIELPDRRWWRVGVA